MEDLLEAIRHEDLGPTTHEKVYDILKKVLGNIVKNPTEAKYRSLKKENKIVADILCRSPSAISMLLALGFEDDGAAYYCPEDTDLSPLQETVDMLECLIASCSETAGAAPSAPPAPAAAAAVAPAAYPAVSRPQRISDEERKRQEQQSQLVAARMAQQNRHEQHLRNPSPSPPAVAAAQPAAQTSAQKVAADAKQKKSAFDFQNRSKGEAKEKAAASSLEDLRAAQKAKFQEFQEDPNAKQQEAYKAPPSIAAGGKTDAGWGDWLGGMFGGGSSSSGSKPSSSNKDRPKPQMKTINDLPKPVQRG